jgi:uncharacterized protein YjbI with pentapeptide repeats
MTRFKQVEKLLKKNGADYYNISDFWFEHKEILQPLVEEKYPTLSRSFELQVRWESKLGRACQKAIRDYLENKQNQFKLQISLAYKRNTNINILFPKPIIDLSIFSFIYLNKTYNLDHFAKSFTTSQSQNIHDLCGIDLSGLNLDNFIFEDCFFALSEFNNCSLRETIFKNCIFSKASFKNTNISFIELENSIISNVDFSGAKIFGISGLNNNSLPGVFKYTKISYLWLILSYLFSIFSKKELNSSKIGKYRKHTIFMLLELENVTRAELKSFKSYVSWFNYVTRKIYDFKSLPLNEKIGFSLSLILTKSWASLPVLGFSILTINLIFATIFYLNWCNFKGLSQDFVQSFYYSVVTFATLGYGEITPGKSGAQLLIIFEVFLGYIFLGMFVFMLGNKVNDRY